MLILNALDGCSSRRPAELTATEQVEVEMIDRLPAIFANVDHDAITVGKSLASRYFARGAHEVAEQVTMPVVGFFQ